MDQERFLRDCSFPSLSEADKVCHLAFFRLKTAAVQEFTAADGADWLEGAGGAMPNRSRLAKNLASCPHTLRGRRGFRLRREFVAGLEGKFPEVGADSQFVADEGSILPEVDYAGTRGYVESLAKQINVCYERNAFDGCAVLMRRLIEVLLILSYRKMGAEDSIRGSDGSHVPLDRIIGRAAADGSLALSRNGRGSLAEFKQLGNFSAHKIEYTCRREYIRPRIADYQALVSELMYKSGLRQ